MINSKSISLFACAWGDQRIPTMRAFGYCLHIFPIFDEVVFFDKVNNLFDYNRFMVEDLNSVIKTDYVITVQSDGFIINPNLWKNSFLDFDYVGAPWSWHNVCGNGGFSLRSKRFMTFSSKLKYNPIHKEYKLCPEDSFLCHPDYNRNYMIENGIKFSDIKSGLDFSFEHSINEFPNHTIKDSFGFHGKHNL